MKKILLAVFAVAALMASCQKSNQEKADALVGEEMKKILYFPDSYEAVETVLDSAFSPLDDPALYEKTLKMTEHLKNLTQLDARMKIDKSTMAIYSGPYQTAYDRDKYNEAKEEYVNASEEKRKVWKLSRISRMRLKRNMLMFINLLDLKRNIHIELKTTQETRLLVKLNLFLTKI